jgi:type II secretory pathway pseudopilin PulG
MIKREDGFTLLELMITMITFVIVIASVSSIFLGLVNQFKQQSKIAETNLEGLTGLEILRQDLEHAGYGVPWFFQSAINYNEAATAPASNYNDSPSDSPKAVLSGNNIGFNASDYLVIKSMNVARNDASQMWTTLKASAPYVRTWTPARENLAVTDNVIILFPGATDLNSRTLVVNGGAFSTTYSNVTAAPWVPTDLTDTRLVYGVDPDTVLRMPFNRADYFIEIQPNTDVPDRCAPNTGVLVKAVVSHNDGNFDDFMPLLDCVADIQVIYRLDITGDGIIDNNTDDIHTIPLTAQQIREQVKEVRVYILAHEGQRDVNYTYPNSTITIPSDPSDPGAGLGSTFNLSSSIGTGWQNYRWKVYTIVINPNNMRST